MFAQAVGVVLSPVLSRLYSPQDYGVFGLYISALSIVLTVGCLCYEQAIPIAADDSEALGATLICVLSLVLVSVVACGFLLLKLFYRTGHLSSGCSVYLWLLPLGILGSGVYRVVRYWALRQREIKAIGRTTVQQVLWAQFMNLSFGLFHPSPLGLILAGITGQTAGALGLAKRTELLPRDLRGLRELVRFRWLFGVAKKYWKLPLVVGPSTLFNSLGLYLPGMLIVLYYGEEAGGQLNLAQRLVGLPMGLIGGSISQVFFSEAAVIARTQPGRLGVFCDAVLWKAAKLSLAVLALGLISPFMVPIVFGHRWGNAGIFCLWLSFYSVLALGVSAISWIPTIVGRFLGQFLLDVTRALLVFLAFYLPHVWGQSAGVAMQCFVAAMVVNYIACCLLYRYQAKAVAESGRTSWAASAGPDASVTLQDRPFLGPDQG
jgi:O-antigen/teichoic acid export membrane protein